MDAIHDLPLTVANPDRVRNAFGHTMFPFLPILCVGLMGLGNGKWVAGLFLMSMAAAFGGGGPYALYLTIVEQRISRQLKRDGHDYWTWKHRMDLPARLAVLPVKLHGSARRYCRRESWLDSVVRGAGPAAVERRRR